MQVPSLRPLRALLAGVSLFACSDTGGEQRAAVREPHLGLELPAQGFQIRSLGSVIQPGEDAQYCEIAEFPGELGKVYNVRGFELGNAQYGHHLMVSRARRGTRAEAALRAMPIGERVKCFGAQLEWGEDQIDVLDAIQKPYGRSDFVEGVGIELTGGERLIFDYHYINPTAAPVEARSALNVHVTDEPLTRLARVFRFNNFTLDVPPRSNEGFVAECSFKEDVVLGGVQRHTHQYGTDFSVWFEGGPRHGEHIWTSTDWQHDLGHVFEEPVSIAAGDGLRFECGFENSTDRSIRYGINATDEMCMLGGVYFSPTGSDTLQNCKVVWTDAEGIGHTADSAGGFPPADPSDASLCLLGQQLIPSAGGPECGACLCTSCASVMLKCVRDADCRALVECFTGGCEGLDGCVNACEDEIKLHSSAVGLLEQISECMSHGCPSCSAW